jgi:hypothetical protein
MKRFEEDRMTKGVYTYLYRPIKKQGKVLSWELITRNWKRDRVMLPKKNFRGTAGAFERVIWQYKLVSNRDDAVRFLRLQCYEDFLFHISQSFSLQCPRCPLSFKEKGEWAWHAIFTSHDVRCGLGDAQEGQSRYYMSEKVSNDVETILLEAESSVLKQQQKVQESFKEWFLVQSADLEASKASFLKQLESDPLYKHCNVADECDTFRAYCDWITPDVT